MLTFYSVNRGDFAEQAQVSRPRLTQGAPGQAPLPPTAQPGEGRRIAEGRGRSVVILQIHNTESQKLLNCR